MSELMQTWLQLAPANGEDPGRVANVFYKIEGGKVVMYGATGKPFVDGDGQRYEGELGGTEAPEQIALRLAKTINTKLGSPRTGFNGPLRYPSYTPV